MGFLVQLALARSAALNVNSTTPTTDVDECGDLGVMPIPDGADPSHYRKCLLHPAGNFNPHEHMVETDRPREADIAELESKGWPQEQDELVEAISKWESSPNNVFASKRMACWYDSYWGCSRDGWCWSSCGCCPDLEGYWCWLAGDYGRGPWLRCTRNDQCNPTLSPAMMCGGGCGC